MGVATFAALSSDVDMPTTGIKDSLLPQSLYAVAVVDCQKLMSHNDEVILADVFCA